MPISELDEAENYAIAGLFTLALHDIASEGGCTWGEPEDDEPSTSSATAPPPSLEPGSDADIAYWGKDLVVNGLLDNIYSRLHLPSYKWDGLKALPCVAPAADWRAHYNAVRSLVGVLDPVLAATLPEVATRRPVPQPPADDDGGDDNAVAAGPSRPHTGYLPSANDMLMHGDVPDSPLTPIDDRDMAAADRLWDGLLTSSDDEDYKEDLEMERRLEEKQRRHQRHSSATSPKHEPKEEPQHGGRLSHRESIEAKELLQSLADAAEQHPDHTELSKKLQELELEVVASPKGGEAGGERTNMGEEEMASPKDENQPESAETQKDKIENNNGTEEEQGQEPALSASPAAVAAVWELLQCSIAASLPPEPVGKSTKASPSVVKRRVRWYDARARVAVRQVASWLQLPWRKVVTLEMLLGSDKTPSAMKHDALDAERLVQSSSLRALKVGLAAGAGGLLFAITGGLAAPAIAAGVGSVLGLIPGAGAAAGFVSTTAGLAAVTGTMAGAGAATTGTKMAHRTGDVQEFGFLVLPDVGEDAPMMSSIPSTNNTDPAAADSSTHSGSTSSAKPDKEKDADKEEPLPVLLYKRGANEGIRLSVVVGISGWISKKEEDFVMPWMRVQAPASDRFACVWETKELLALDSALGSLLAKQVAGQALQFSVKHLLAAGTGLVTAIAPTVLLGTAAGLLISNSWAICMDRAEKAGKLLARLLMAGAAGDRPVTLVAHGMGARLAFHCLLELCRHGARGIVQDAVLLGAPVSRAEARWRMARRVVSGRLINGYSKQDWLLSALCWEGGLAAGLAAVEAPGVENINVSEIVKGHLEYLDRVQEIVDLLQLEL